MKGKIVGRKMVKGKKVKGKWEDFYDCLEWVKVNRKWKERMSYI